MKERLQAKPGFAQAAELIDQQGTPASDTGEPSWGVMAQMIRETRFVQVFRRLYFFTSMLAAPADDYWTQVRDEVAGHRYRPYLEILALPEHAWAESFRQFGDQIDLVDLEPRAAPMIRSLAAQGRPRSKNAWNVALAHADETAEMAVPLCQTDESMKVIMARDILTSSPYQPYARAVLIDKAWDHVKDKVPEWEKESGNTPALLSALARRDIGAKQYEDAERIVARYIDISPDGGAFRLFASTYKAQGKMDRWLETLEASLKAEDFGLDHARARVEIADYYMGLKDWDKARPYAEEAAATWAGWAMNCAGRCAEGEKAWGRAEEWFKRETERYPGTAWAVWYFFCKRTGHGDLAAAAASIEQYLANEADQRNIQNEEYAGCYHWLEGQTEKAKSEFASAYRTRTSISAALCLAMVFDDEKNAGKRDELVNELVARHGDKAPKSIAICRLFLQLDLRPGWNEETARSRRPRRHYQQHSRRKPRQHRVLRRVVSQKPRPSRSSKEIFRALRQFADHPELVLVPRERRLEAPGGDRSSYERQSLVESRRFAHRRSLRLPNHARPFSRASPSPPEKKDVLAAYVRLPRTANGSLGPRRLRLASRSADTARLAPSALAIVAGSVRSAASSSRFGPKPPTDHSRALVAADRSMRGPAGAGVSDRRELRNVKLCFLFLIALIAVGLVCVSCPPDQYRRLGALARLRISARSLDSFGDAFSLASSRRVRLGTLSARERPSHWASSRSDASVCRRHSQAATARAR